MFSALEREGRRISFFTRLIVIASLGLSTCTPPPRPENQTAVELEKTRVAQAIETEVAAPADPPESYITITPKPTEIPEQKPTITPPPEKTPTIFVVEVNLDYSPQLQKALESNDPAITGKVANLRTWWDTLWAGPENTLPYGVPNSHKLNVRFVEDIAHPGDLAYVVPVFQSDELANGAVFTAPLDYQKNGNILPIDADFARKVLTDPQNSNHGTVPDNFKPLFLTGGNPSYKLARYNGSWVRVDSKGTITERISHIDKQWVTNPDIHYAELLASEDQMVYSSAPDKWGTDGWEKRMMNRESTTYPYVGYYETNEQTKQTELVAIYDAEIGKICYAKLIDQRMLLVSEITSAGKIILNQELEPDVAVSKSRQALWGLVHYAIGLSGPGAFPDKPYSAQSVDEEAAKIDALTFYSRGSVIQGTAGIPQYKEGKRINVPIKPGDNFEFRIGMQFNNRPYNPFYITETITDQGQTLTSFSADRLQNDTIRLSTYTTGTFYLRNEGPEYRPLWLARALESLSIAINESSDLRAELDGRPNPSHEITTADRFIRENLSDRFSLKTIPPFTTER